MTEAVRNLFSQPDAPMPAGGRSRAVNGAGLRWTPGPDELRLPSCEDEPVLRNTRQIAVILDCAGGFLPTSQELADDKRRLADEKRRAEAELEALIEKMRRG